MLMIKYKLRLSRGVFLILLAFSIVMFPMASVNGADDFINLTYNAGGYNVVTGTYISGTIPASAQTVDQDYFIANSAGSATSTKTYNPSSYSLGSNTTLASGAPENLTSNDGVYMIFRSYENKSCVLQYYNSSNVGSSTTDVAYTDKVILNFTPSSAGNYLVIASAELRGSSNAYNVRVQMTIDGIVYASPMWEPDDVNMWESFFTSKVIYFDRSSHAIRVQYSSENVAQTVTIRNARIMALMLSDFEGSEIEGEQAVSSGTYVDVVSNTFTSTTAGIYLILATAEVTAASTTYSFSTRLEIDGIAQDEMVTEGEAVTDYEVFAAHNVTALSAASHTIKIQANRETTGTMFIRRARITAVRLTDYYEYHNSGSEQSSSTSSTTWVDKTILTFTPSSVGDYLVVATAKINLATSLAGYQPAINFTLDGSQIGFWQAGLSDSTDFLTFAALMNVSLSAVSHTFKIAYRTTNAFFASSIRDAKIVAVRLAQQYVSEVEFSDVSNDYGWAQLAISADSCWTVGSVSVCIQLYDFQHFLYPSTGQGYDAYVSDRTPHTDELRTLNVTDNPPYYRSSTGAWKMRIRGVKSTSLQPAQFDFKIDQVEFRPIYYSEYTVSSELLFSSLTPNVPSELNFTLVSHYSLTSVSITVQVWNYSSSVYATNGQGCVQYVSSGVNETVLLRLNTNPQFFASAGNAKIKVTGVLSTTTQYRQEINQVKLDYSYVNSPPVLNPIGNKIVGELTELTFTVTASDLDIPAQPLTFELDVNAPLGASITADGVFSWTPTEEQGPGNYLVRVLVTDGLLVDYEEISITVFEVHIHDVAIINVATSPTSIVSGEVVTISVQVKNQGTATETFNITVFFDETAIETRTVADLVPGDLQTLEFSWNTTGVSDATYTMRAEASTVSGESQTSNNGYAGSTLKVGGQASLLPFDWVTLLLSALLVLFALFLFILLFRRRRRIRQGLLKKNGLFSEQFGVKHRQIAGKKILLEIDPSSDYNLALSGFVTEAGKSDEPIFIVTNKTSALRSSFSEAANVRFLLLTSKTHYPQQVNERETFLPADDLSVLLDACAKIHEVEPEKNVNLLFDNVSDIILRLGFDKTYNFTRLLLEAISSSKVTALFMFIPTAHDQEVSSSVRGLFQIHLAYAKSGPESGNL